MELRKIIKKNKKGQLAAIAGIALVAMLIIVGAFFFTVGSGVLTYVSGTVNDITSGLGMAGSSNLSAISDVSIGTLNTTIQMLQWGSGIMIMFGLFGLVIFAGAIRSRPNGFLIGLYLLLVIILIFTSIYMSNTYEELLGGTDELALELQGMTMASYLILYMPGIMTIMSFIGGIIIFSGIGEDSF